jgi:hypothetical protein
MLEKSMQIAIFSFLACRMMDRDLTPISTNLGRAIIINKQSNKMSSYLMLVEKTDSYQIAFITVWVNKSGINGVPTIINAVPWLKVS